jgi:site-specific recombinase XerD
MAGLLWNQWQLCCGISGRLHLESVACLAWNTQKAAGISKKASCHTLRHTFATYKAEKGVSPFQLQQWLGHANLNTTQIYVHLGKQNAKKIMEQTSLA